MHRLDRILANRGYCTRSQAKEYLQIHEVAAAGKVLTNGSAKVDPNSLTIDQTAIDPETLLILLHKPMDYVCSHREHGNLIYDLLPERWRFRNPKLASVGRLDKETTGLLLITDDGELLHRLTSPKKHVPRVYVATLDRKLNGTEVEVFQSGRLMLEDEDKPLLPAEMQVLDDTHARLTLHEGRYHQVRRMFAAVGNHVLALHREAFGAITLEGLNPGEYRLLDPTTA